MSVPGHSQNALMRCFLMDTVEIISVAELRLLRRIAETSNDMVKARNWAEFRDACGGQERIDNALISAVNEYKRWLMDGDG